MQKPFPPRNWFFELPAHLIFQTHGYGGICLATLCLEMFLAWERNCESVTDSKRGLTFSLKRHSISELNANSASRQSLASGSEAPSKRLNKSARRLSSSSEINPPEGWDI